MAPLTLEYAESKWYSLLMPRHCHLSVIYSWYTTRDICVENIKSFYTECSHDSLSNYCFIYLKFQTCLMFHPLKC